MRRSTKIKLALTGTFCSIVLAVSVPTVHSADPADRASASKQPLSAPENAEGAVIQAGIETGATLKDVDEGVPVIHVAPGKYNDYFHLRFSLTPENCELTVPVSERLPNYTDSNDYSFSDGGQFEVFVRKIDFPVPAPHTDREFLILRMPWTNSSHTGADKFVAQKRKLFDQIRQMKNGGRESVVVTIQLNPYVNVLKKNPLTVELSGRNIFFRQAHGEYMDYVGPLRNKQSTEHDKSGAVGDPYR